MFLHSGSLLPGDGCATHYPTSAVVGGSPQMRSGRYLASKPYTVGML